MTLQERLAQLQAELKTLTGKMSTLNETMETKTYDSDEAKADDQSAFNDFDVEAKALVSRIDNINTSIAAQAKSVAVSATPASVTPAVVVPAVELTKEAKSLFIARQAHALFVAGGNNMAASQYAKETLGDELLSKSLMMHNKAAVLPGDSVTTGWAAELVQINQMNEAFIELLRPMSVVARFPGRQMTFDGYGSIKIPRQTAGTSGGFLAENAAIPVGALAFDSITLDPKKMGTIVACSNELLARSTPSAMALVRDDILQGIATAIDTKFVSADAAVAGVSPAGIQTFDTSPTASTGTDLNAITADLKAAINALMVINMPMAAPVWLLNPVTANALRFIRDGLGMYAFQDQMNKGYLMGYPFLVSTTVPSDIVMLSDASQIILASALAPQIMISQDTSIMMDSAPTADIGGAATPVQSMFQTDSTAIRGLVSLDWATRYANSTQVITGVAWT